MNQLKLMEKKPILYAVIWIVIYMALVGGGDMLSESMQVSHLATSILLMILSVVLLKIALKQKYFTNFKVSKDNAQKCLFYVPLVIFATIQFIGGIDSSLKMREIGIIIVMMIGVGFVEELLFRGFLFKGILKKSGVKRAVLISGITFGLGHIVNLLNGYGSFEQLSQIVLAVTVGIVLALLVAITDSLVPGILFHIVFNISGSITNQESNLETVILIVILALALPYALYLSKLVGRQTEVGEPGPAAEVRALKTS